MAATPEWGDTHCAECGDRLPDVALADGLCRRCRQLAERDAPAILHRIEVALAAYERAQAQYPLSGPCGTVVREATAAVIAMVRKEIVNA